jgi:hypothetical protein
VHDLSGLPAAERVPAEQNIAAISRWHSEHPDVDITVGVDRASLEAGQGHVTVVVLTAATEVDRVRRELLPLAPHPDRVRVRRHRPDAASLHAVLRIVMERYMPAHPPGPTWVTSVGIDEAEGVVVATLNRTDDEYAAHLRQVCGPLLRISPRPTTVMPIQDAETAS